MTLKTSESKKIIEVLPPVKSLPLTRMGHIRHEMAKVYREARTGKIDLGDATKLTYILQALGRIIEGSELEARIEALEEAQQGESNHGGFR